MFGVTAPAALLVSADLLPATAGAVALTGRPVTLDSAALVFEVVDLLPSGTTATYSDIGLDPATWYVYRIVAVNALGETLSNTATAQTLPAAATAYTLTASPGGLTVGGISAGLVLTVTPLLAGSIALTGAPLTAANTLLLTASPLALALTPAEAMVQATTRAHRPGRRADHDRRRDHALARIQRSTVVADG